MTDEKEERGALVSRILTGQDASSDTDCEGQFDPTGGGAMAPEGAGEKTEGVKGGENMIATDGKGAGRQTTVHERTGRQDGESTGESVRSEQARLADGTSVELRPIRPDDVPRLVEFHEALSFETVYRRFFGVHPHLGSAEAEHFCNVDATDRFALVAVVNEEIVGVARMERIRPPSVAEVAFVVADRFQHRGLGRILARRLAAAAVERGVREFVADTLPENGPMLHLLSDAGFNVQTSSADGVVRLTCPI